MKTKVCCFKSKKLIKTIEIRARSHPNFRPISCKSKTRSEELIPHFLKLHLRRNRNLCIGIDIQTSSPFCLNSSDLKRHVLVVGSSGSGKSTTIKKIVSELSNNFLIFDWHGEYDLVHRKVNCIDLNELSKLKVHELMDLFSIALDLSDAQYYVLFKVVQVLYKTRERFGLIDLIAQIHSFEETSRWIKETKHSILRKLEMLRHERCREGVKLDEILDLVSKGLIVNLEEYSEYAKRFLTGLVLSYVFSELSKRKIRKDVYVVIEEAQNVASTSNSYSIIDKIFQEGRKYGLHIIAVTQSPRNLNEAVVKNTMLKIIHKMNEVSDAKYIAESIGRPELWKDVISLRTGEAIVSSGSYVVRVFVTLRDRAGRSLPTPHLDGDYKDFSNIL
ncbi:ATP-binding protein [Ignicoccus islandicus]|nr:ATP-binding protein [Ignicoccus islandicus]